MSKARSLDERIEDYCNARGMIFQPWEVVPWEVGDGPLPAPDGTAWTASKPKAQELRRQIIEAIGN